MLNQNSRSSQYRGASSPLISVVLPVYNGEKYLAEAIESVLAQTFNDFELIMIDDGSTDGSLAILRQYEKCDTRIVIVSRENRNLATTLNVSIDIARGKWIARMDQDDIALPHRFEKQLHWLEHTHADICGSWVRRFGTSDKRVARLRQTDEAIKMEMLFVSPFAHPSVMMKTELVKHLRYDKLWEKAEDYDLWERAAKAGLKMTNVPEVLLLYRLHETQISTASSLRQHQLCHQIRRRHWASLFEAAELEPWYIDEVLKIDGPLTSVPNMNVVDIVLTKLLLQTHGEARDAILGHAIRLYLRVAADCPDIVSRWDKLYQKIGGRPSFSSCLKLWVLHNLKIRPEGKVFALLKKLYVSLIRST